MPEKDRRRAERRHHRRRVIAARHSEWRQAAVWPDVRPPRPPGELADGQRWLGCGVPRCGLCHPEKRPGNADRQRGRERWQRDALEEGAPGRVVPLP